MNVRDYEPVALTGGTWQPVRGVLRWVPDPDAPPPPPRDLHQLVACPTCRCRADQTCRTKGGRRTTPHGSRLIGRYCPCGSPVAYRKRYCTGCAVEINLEAKRASRRRLAAVRGELEVAS